LGRSREGVATAKGRRGERGKKKGNEGKRLQGQIYRTRGRRGKGKGNKNKVKEAVEGVVRHTRKEGNN